MNVCPKLYKTSQLFRASMLVRELKDHAGRHRQFLAAKKLVTIKRQIKMKQKDGWVVEYEAIDDSVSTNPDNRLTVEEIMVLKTRSLVKHELTRKKAKELTTHQESGEFSSVFVIKYFFFLFETDTESETLADS